MYPASGKMVQTKLHNVPALKEDATTDYVKRPFKQLEGAAKYADQQNPEWLKLKTILPRLHTKLIANTTWVDKHDFID